MVEFALVVPILLIVLLAVADFGRIFAAMVTVEAATRDAAEATANQYLANPPGPLNSPAPGGSPSYYDSLHSLAESVVCAELRSLPNTNYDPGTNTCPDMPAVLICVHDGQDGDCATPAQPGSAGIPAQCGDLSPAPTTSQNGSMQRWVEVRTCYHYTSLLTLPILPFSDFWLQRSRSFTIPCYFVLGTGECG